VTLSWQINLDMTSISDPTSLDNGGLNITLTMPPLPSSSQDVKRKNPECVATYEESSWGVQKAPKWMADYINDKFIPKDSTHPDVIRAFEPILQSKLSGQNRWIFPGYGKFTMQNPMFNENGDLLVEIAYS
jgi:hypothetical protein